MEEFIYGEFIIKPRDMFLHPGYNKQHQLNQDRPKTIKEAFDRAYSTYERYDIDEFILAYHYAEKIKATYMKAEIAIIYKTIKLKYIPVAEGFEAMMEFAFKKKPSIMALNLLLRKKILCETKQFQINYIYAINLLHIQAVTIPIKYLNAVCFIS